MTKHCYFSSLFKKEVSETLKGMCKSNITDRPLNYSL